MFGKIKQRLGKLHYLIDLDDGRQWRRHIDQLRSVGFGVQSSSPNDFFSRGSGVTYFENAEDNVAITSGAGIQDYRDAPDSTIDSNISRPTQAKATTEAAEGVLTSNGQTDAQRPTGTADPTVCQGLRRSSRTVRVPQRLDL